MIPEVTQLAENLYNLNVSTLVSDRQQELFGLAYDIALAAGKTFANRKHRGKDAMFVDECQAEALFIVTSIIWNELEDIQRKWPAVDDRRGFYYQLIGYRLKAYFSFWRTSTTAYLKKRGINCDIESLESVAEPTTYTHEEDVDILDHAVRTPTERRVLDKYLYHKDHAMVAAELNITEKASRAILAKITKRVKNSRN